MSFVKSLASISAAALVLAPVAASAGTSASSAVPAVGSSIASAARSTSPVAKKSNVNAGEAALGIAGGALFIFGAVKIFDDNKKKSSGT